MMKPNCRYSGHKLAEMMYANFTEAELLDATKEEEPVTCPRCGAVRKPRWRKRTLGGRGSGCWQWDLVFPHHTQKS
jgi:ssDNA-binding Zn-finger/Zn-ribbon topoisomerase 1